MSLHITLNDIIPCLLGNTVLTTLTNHGYLLYTLNMLKSLRLFGLDKKILIIAIDRKSHGILKKLGYNTVCINESLAAFYPWNTEGYDKVCYYKLELIYRILSLGKSVLVIDGDIVFQQNPEADIAHWNQSADDVWIQNDGIADDNTQNMCTGYMFIRSNDKMVALYDCISESGKEKYAKCVFNNNDQTYFNDYVKPTCSMMALPLCLYPNGNIFYAVPSLKEHAILVHFNWVKGHQKMAKMKEHRMWLLTAEEEYF